MTQEELVKPGDGSMGGFSTPPEGMNEFEFVSKELKVVGEDKDCLWLELAYLDDPSAKVGIFCKYSTDPGLRKLLDTIIRSGVWPKMQKKYKYKSDPTEGLPPSMLRDEKFQQRLILELEGLRIMCDVSIKKASGEQKYDQANVNKIEAVNSSKSEVKQHRGPAADSSKVEEQESGW